MVRERAMVFSLSATRKRYKSHTASAAEAAKAADVLVLAVKPQDVASVAAETKPYMDGGKLLISIAAGKTTAVLRKAFGTKARIVRVMPNLALVAKEGMSAIAGAKNATEEDIAFAERLLGAAGKTVRLPEKAFDAVTALSGSGPAFYAYMEQAMADAGRELGLPAAAAALRATGANCDDFIAAVCSKGGTTAAGMKALSARGAFRKTVSATLKAAAERSAELAKV